MTFAYSGPQGLPAHFPQSGSPPDPMNIVSDWFRFLTRPISKRFDFVIRFVTRLIKKKTSRFSGCVCSNWSNKTFWIFGYSLAVSCWFRFFTRPVETRFDFVIRFVTHQGKQKKNALIVRLFLTQLIQRNKTTTKSNYTNINDQIALEL